MRADPGMVTRIIIRFEGFTGRYVWHCHILEHEDNEMMRPFDVVPLIQCREISGLWMVPWAQRGKRKAVELA